MVPINGHCINLLTIMGCLKMGCKWYVSLATFVVLMSINFLSMAANNLRVTCQFLSASKQVKKILPTTSQIIVVKTLGGIKAKYSYVKNKEPHGTQC